MTNSSNRKTRVVTNSEIFEQVKRLYKTKSKRELLEITSLSKSALNKLIRKLETYEISDEPSFENLFNTPGRKKKDKNALHSEIRSLFGNDNSLTQRGCNYKLATSISSSTFSREVKAAGLSRKRI